MDAGLLRGLFTLFMFVAFLGIVFWAWSSRRHSEFDAAAQLPLEDDAEITPNDPASGSIQLGAKSQ